MKYISKQWQLNVRDYLISLYYGIAIPILSTIQSLIDSGQFDFDKKKLLMLIVSSVIAHLIRKASEPTKVIEVQKLSDLEDDGDRNNPPPLGDPTHPKN